MTDKTLHLEVEIIDGVTFVTSPDIVGLLSAHDVPAIALFDVYTQVVSLAGKNGSANIWADPTVQQDMREDQT